jgi:hypothetical protein
LLRAASAFCKQRCSRPDVAYFFSKYSNIEPEQAVNLSIAGVRYYFCDGIFQEVVITLSPLVTSIRFAIS